MRELAVIGLIGAAAVTLLYMTRPPNAPPKRRRRGLRQGIPLEPYPTFALNPLPQTSPLVN